MLGQCCAFCGCGRNTSTRVRALEGHGRSSRPCIIDRFRGPSGGSSSALIAGRAVIARGNKNNALLTVPSLRCTIFGCLCSERVLLLLRPRLEVLGFYTFRIRILAFVQDVRKHLLGSQAKDCHGLLGLLAKLLSFLAKACHRLLQLISVAV